MAANRRNADSRNGKSSERSSYSKYKTGKRHQQDVTEKTSAWSMSNIARSCFIFALAIGISYFHRNHIAGMFERDRHFSHLSSLEREISFRTEMGLYYSYFKTVIETPTYLEGIYAVSHDNITEYPDTINTLKRFNLYPEVVIGGLYRLYEGVNAYLGYQTKQCWTVNRGDDLPPVPSCEGLGDPAYFYVETVFTLNGAMMGLFFLFGTYLSGSLFGGIITVVCFIFNHGEATRVQWTPPLRESFGYPFLVLEMLIITHVLRSKDPGLLKYSLLIASACVPFMLFWQFAQFALLTQTMSVFGVYVLQFIDKRKIKVILIGQILGLLISYILLFRNEMLLTSFYASCLLTVALIVFLEPVLNILRLRIIIWIGQGVLLCGCTVGCKLLLAKLFNVQDDKHIGDIFRSKFSDFRNFHTMLYICAAEFDYIDKTTLILLMKTLLIPSAVIALLAITFMVLKREYEERKNTDSIENSSSKNNKSSSKHKEHAELVYHVFQTLAFTAMAVCIMRLKLFFTPHLCLMASLLASRDIFSWIGKKEWHFALLALLVAGSSYQGLANYKKQMGILGEFNNVPMEELIEWITTKTPHNAVFAGPMPTMATVKLCTKRPIVNHPHYEDAGLRARTMKVYSMYSRKPEELVHKNFLDLQVDYAILENSWCVRKTKPGCMMPEIWDIEDVENRGKTPVCMKLKEKPGPYFKRVFRNVFYDVLKVLKS
ncbi:hypothetical protein SNE40_023346 [Patella caerulea]|uniref:C-mannosyltransferase DPY19L1 n=1 Tax=Patella caerulea TaxID=87958 RepID=A0AAN8IYL1_PATCE